MSVRVCVSFLCPHVKSSVFILYFFFFLLHFFFYNFKDKTKEEEEKKLSGGGGTHAKSNASQIAQYVVVKGRRGRESAHGVSSETLPGLRVLVRGARGRNYRVLWCGHKRRAKLLFRGEKCKGKEEDVKET